LNILEYIQEGNFQVVSWFRDSINQCSSSPINSNVTGAKKKRKAEESAEMQQVGKNMREGPFFNTVNRKWKQTTKNGQNQNNDWTLQKEKKEREEKMSETEETGKESPRVPTTADMFEREKREEAWLVRAKEKRVSASVLVSCAPRHEENPPQSNRLRCSTQPKQKFMLEEPVVAVTYISW
jgi:hypothetical protein